jgi:hypothetical protein
VRREVLYQSQVRRGTAARDARVGMRQRRGGRTGPAHPAAVGMIPGGCVRRIRPLTRELDTSQAVVEIMGCPDVLVMPMWAVDLPHTLCDVSFPVPA